MWGSPSSARVANHTRTTGPKSRPTFSVPRRWTMNSPTRIAAVIGTTNGSKAGVAIFRPSTALSTDTAGVSIPSPKSRAAPKSPMNISRGRSIRCLGIILFTRVVRARTPPWPWWSARRTKTMYLIETMIIKAQKIKDKTPRTWEGPG